MALILTFLFLHSISLVNAAIYITAPSQNVSCTGGSPCTANWVDDGKTPLLTAFGWSHVGLYTGTQQLVQSINPVDVSATHSTTFTPNPKAGPNSDAYYIAFTSIKSVDSNGLPSIGFSPYFSITGMSGSFNSPLPEATSAIPLPPIELLSTSVTRTVTVGMLSTSSPFPTISNSSQTSAFPAIQSASPSLSTSAKFLTSTSASTSIASPSLSTSASTSTSASIPTSVDPLTLTSESFPSFPSLTFSSDSTATSLPATKSKGSKSNGTTHLPKPLYVVLLTIFSSILFS